MTTKCASCDSDNPSRAISANYWVADANASQFGGYYERRDFCSLACAKAAPKYVAPKKPRTSRPPVVAISGGWEQAAKPRKSR